MKSLVVHLPLLMLFLSGVTFAIAADSPSHALLAQSTDAPAEADSTSEETKLVPLNPSGTVLMDRANGRLLVKTKVCLREGLLEMLMCPKQTKEHESILSYDGKVQVIHAGLLALGAEPGKPVQFQPEFTPPTGQQIEIHVIWKDKDGKEHRRPAQEWIRQSTRRYFEADLAAVPSGVPLNEGDDSLRYDQLNKQILWYGIMSDAQRDEFLKLSSNEAYQKAIRSLHEQSQVKPMQADFVFTGSSFAPVEGGGEVYLAQAGSAICVANFSDAMIDVGVRSSASNDVGLLYEPWTERVPPLETEVMLELKPVKEKTED